MPLQPPLPITVELAIGADPGASPSTWTWTSSGIRWRQKAGLTIAQGRDDEDSEVGPGAASATLDDRDGKLSPRNALGEWFGQIGKNTPVRFVLDTFTDTFTRSSGSGWGTEPDSGRVWAHAVPSLWTATGSGGTVTLSTPNTFTTATLGGAVGRDAEILRTTSVSVSPTGAAWVDAVFVRMVDGNNTYRVYTEFGIAGTVNLKIVRIVAGALTTLVTAPAGPAFTAGTLIDTRIRVVGTTIQARIWVHGTTEPTTWAASATDSMVDGADFGFYILRVGGNTNPGSIVGTTDNIQIRTALYTGTVPEWPVRWPDRSGRDCVTPIEAAGILRYLEQGDQPLRSPIDLNLTGGDPVAYWKIEEGASATAAGSAVSGGATATGVDLTFGNDDSPPGALASVSLNTAITSHISGRVPKWEQTQDGYAVIVYAKFGSLPPASPARTFLDLSAVGKVTRWIVTADAASFNLTGYDSSGTVVDSTSGTAYVIDPRQWFAFQIKVSEVGSNVAYQMAWHQVGDDVFYVGSGTNYAGTADRVTGATVRAPADDTLVDHLWVGDRDVPFTTGEFVGSSNGYVDEEAADRVARVFPLAGIEVAVMPGLSMPMGAQSRASTSLEVARDAEKADLGRLYERGGILVYEPHGARFDVPVAMALDWALGHLGEEPLPTDDDQQLRNQWTMSRPGGSERTHGNQDSIDRYRLYSDSGEANVAEDDSLLDLAGWKVGIGTVDELRWPRISINLVAHPELIPDWLGCRVGSRFTVANVPDQIAGEVVDLIIEGYTQTINKHEWIVEMNCSPAKPWIQVGIYDDSESRYDADTTTLAAGATISAVTFSLTTTNRLQTWSTTSLPYDGQVAGEVVTVTGMTAAAGTGPYTQTATVTRAVNGIAKAQDADEKFSLARPVRYGY